MISPRRALFLVAGLTAFAVTGAQSQAPGPPLILTPPPVSGAEAAPTATPAAPAAPAIAVDALAPPHPDAMGLVDARAGGFPEDMWRTSQPEIVRVLFADLPRRYVALSARRLALRFLLSAAPPPTVREAGPAANGSAAGSAVLEARVAALGALGAWDDALALPELVPADARSAGLARLHLDALLIGGKTEAACGEAQRALSSSATPDPRWQKVQVFCQFATGQVTAAGLGIDVLREQGIDDPGFFWAAAMLQGNAAPPPAELVKADKPIDPLILAMLRRTGRLPPAEVLDTQDPTALLVAAQIAAASAKAAGPVPETNLAAVERAVMAGVAQADVLREIYAKAKGATPAAPAGQIAIDTPLQRAAAYQLAAAQSVPTARAEVIARVYDFARKGPQADGAQVRLVGLVYAPTVRALAPSADLAWFAGTAVRILLIADAAGADDPRAGGQSLRDQVQAWLELVRGMGLTSQEAGGVNNGLWPYRQLLAGGAMNRDSALMWAAGDQDAAPDLALGRRALLLSLLTAVGDGVTLADWEPLIAEQSNEPRPAPGSAPATIAWHAVTVASRAHRTGEGVGLALQLLRNDGAPPSQTNAVVKAIESLAVLDRGADARALAIETALARGL